MYCRYLILAFCIFSVLPSYAQLPSAELLSIYPPIIPAGKTSEISVRGLNIDDLISLQFSDSSVTAKPIMLPESEYRIYPRQSGTRFSVTVPPGFTPQTVEVRARGYFGLSTSRPLVISSADSKSLPNIGGAAHHKPETAPTLPKEAYGYGTTDSSQIDWWKISAIKGQRLLIHCQAERIDSRADATLKLADKTGNVLESDRNTNGRDPMIDFTATEDGDYYVGVYDFLYNGGTDYNYILQCTSKPWIDAVFPPAGKAGETYDATIIGRNLPGGSPGEGYKINGKPVETSRAKISVPATAPKPGFNSNHPARAHLPTFAFQTGGSNTVGIGISDYAVKAIDLDKEPAPFEPPVEIASRFHDENDTDHYRFSAKKGKKYYVEVTGERISGNSDPWLLVEKVNRSSEGNETFSKVRDGDDTSNRGGNTFRYASRDIALNFTSDHDGQYRVTVLNQYATGGPEKTYRLAIREARPDFTVTAFAERAYIDARQAWAANPHLRKGGTFPLRLAIDRKDGFAGAVSISANGLPPGVDCPSITIPAKESTVRIAFSAKADAAPWAGTIELSATAKIAEQQITHPVRLGKLVWGSNDYNTLHQRTRLVPDVALSISEHEVEPALITVTNGPKLTTTIGKKLEIPIKLTTDHSLKGNLTITPVGIRGLSKPPTINIAEGKTEGKLTIDFTKKNKVFNPEVGTWNFILKGTGISKYQRNPQAVARANEEKKHVEALAKKYTQSAATAKVDLAESKKAWDQARQNLATASQAAKADVEQAIAAAEAAYKKAGAIATATEAKRVAAEKEKAAAIAFAANATKLGAQKDVKFATWSLPLTVEVKEAEKPEAKKK